MSYDALIATVAKVDSLVIESAQFRCWTRRLGPGIQVLEIVEQRRSALHRRNGTAVKNDVVFVGFRSSQDRAEIGQICWCNVTVDLPNPVFHENSFV